MKQAMDEIVEIPQGISVSVSNGIVTVKGPKGEVSRKMLDPKMMISVQGSEVKFHTPKFSKKEKTKVGSSVAHLKNMFRGVQDGVSYKLKICSGHFPMNVSVSSGQFIVKNFIGEKVPRVLALSKNVKVTVEGDFVTVDGIDKEVVSQTAASIETLTRRLGFDRRIFQDGIYIVEKNGEKVAQA